MNIIAHRFNDADAFLAWNAGREGRREFVRGQVVDTTGASFGHERIVTALVIALASSVDRRYFEVTGGGIAVKTAVGVRYPDVLVSSAGQRARELAAREPILAAEVLSPSSLEIDFVEKPREYTAIEAMRAYLVLSQDEARAWLWRHTASGWSEPATIEGLDGLLTIEALDVQLTMRDVYGHLTPA